jgi:hypothetical protein
MRKFKLLFFLLLFFVLLCCFGCGSQPQSKPDAKAGQCTINYVADSQRMKRVTFSGGYLRSSPEMLNDNIVVAALNGSKGIIYGDRQIDNVEWAKVTTREGTTGWYSVEPKVIDGKKVVLPLDIMEKTYSTTYPQIGGVAENVAEKINEEIKNYLSVFKYVVGPVGNNLHCRVTYNKNNILSILFESPFVSYRIYPTEDVNNIEFWENVKKYCFVSPLIADAQPKVLYAERSDLQYGLVFDLKTGKRLSYQDFMLHKQDEEVADLLSKFGDDASIQSENFYITEDKEIKVFVSHNGMNPGRVALDLTSLGIKKF